jgi:hypothetical protein
MFMRGAACCCAAKARPRTRTLRSTTRRSTSPSGCAVIDAVQTEIALLSVGDAVMRMDLADQTVMMFRNSATGALNVVYRRSDGHIGWIDPGSTT